MHQILKIHLHLRYVFNPHELSSLVVISAVEMFLGLSDWDVELFFDMINYGLDSLIMNFRIYNHLEKRLNSSQKVISMRSDLVYFLLTYTIVLVLKRTTFCLSDLF
jgi:hypothetical protein